MDATGQHVGTVLQGAYRIDRRIDEGALGTVYVASDLTRPRQVAIKLLHPELATSPDALHHFEHEARAASAIGHPNILEILDVKLPPDQLPYVVMELLDGEPLRRRLERQQRLDLTQTSAIFEQVAAALSAAHARGIVHGDLEPGKIILCNGPGRDDLVKLIGFGASRLRALLKERGDLSAQPSTTSPPALIRALGFLPPELLEAPSGPSDRRADIFAAGAILYQALSGVYPFTGGTLSELRHTIARVEPPPLHTLLPDLPPALSAVVARALSKRPVDRYYTMDLFWRAFAQATTSDGRATRGEDAASSDERDPLIGQRIGNYIVNDYIGAGGMGQVYLAQHPELGRKVAMKVLSEQRAGDRIFAERFITEATTVSRIDHPNIIDVYDFGRLADGRMYYMMEYLEGAELREVLDRRGQMTPAEVLPYLEQICSALQAAHEHGLVHRDLKPENILVLDREPLWLKILDFGIAKLLQPQRQGPALTASGVVLGSPLTMAPEQAAGLTDAVGTKSDLYSLGVILYWMLAGRPPFFKEAPAVLIARHIAASIPPLRELAPAVPALVANVVEQCLDKDPRRRPDSAAALARAFAESMRPTTFDLQPVAAIEEETELLERPARDTKIGAGVVDLELALDVEPQGSGGRTRPDEDPVDSPRPKSSVTTLQGSTGEVIPEELLPEPEPRRRPAARLARWIGLGVGLGAALAALAVSTLLVLRRGQDDAIEAVAGGAAAPQAPPTVRARLKIVPASARVLLDGRPHPGGVLELRRSTATHQLRVEAAGYEPQQRAIKADVDQTIQVTLRRATRPLPTARRAQQVRRPDTTSAAPVARQPPRVSRRSGRRRAAPPGKIPRPAVPRQLLQQQPRIKPKDKKRRRKPPKDDKPRFLEL